MERPLVVRPFQDCPFLSGGTGSDEEGIPVVSQSQAPFNCLLARTGLVLGLQFYPDKKGRLLSKSKWNPGHAMIFWVFLALSKSSPGCWVNRSIFWAQSQSSVNPWSQDDLGSAPMDLLAAEREPMMAGEDGMAGQSKAVSWASKMPSLLAFWNNPARLAGWGQ